MKKIFLCNLLLVTTLFFGQKDFQGMAVYESKTSTSDMAKMFDNNPNVTPEMRVTIMERMKKAFEKTFVLNFNKTESTYKEEEKVEAEGQQGGGGRMMMRMMGDGGKLYKNIKDKSYSNEKEFMGKEFCIQDSLPNFKWELSGESRKIGDYNCFKATMIRKPDVNDYRMKKDADKKEEDKKEEVKKEETQDTKKEGGNRTNFFAMMERPKEVLVTAWYCPDIPVSNGPSDYWGLPGLILEINDGKTVLLCTKIALNTKEKAEIKKLTKGSKVSQKEYDEIVEKKTAEMREQFSKGGGNFQIRRQ